MPLIAKKASHSGVRVPRSPLVTCLTCPLCANLFREATTISECLHTFCRECIESQLSDGETNSCPKCNVSLGTLPLEKLRADNPLPQLTSPYLRIKDGKLPVSHVKKYLVKKLGLGHETEVEITCRGQPVVSSLPLERVRNIWFATGTLPNSKEQDAQGQSNETSGLIQLDTMSAKELIMVLTYQRHRRNSSVC